MADNDLSKIVSLIMENPKLIEEIKAIANQSKGEESPEKTAESEDVINVIKEGTLTDTIRNDEESVNQKRGHRARRGELLRALKPYLSSERSKAIESMISITEILDMMRES